MALHILHVLDSLQIGGTEWQCLSLATHLDPTRFRNTILCFNRGGPLLEVARGAGLAVEVVPFPGFRRPGAAASLARLADLMRRQRVHIVQSYGFYSNAPALLAGWWAGARIRVASRRDMGMFLGRLDRLAERAVFRLADRVVVNARAIRAELIASGQVPGERIVVIPTGVDLDRFDRPVPAGRPPWAGEGKVVGMVAKFRRQKDQQTFLLAARRVLAVDPTVVFVLAGDGPLRGSVEQLAREMGLAGSVWFIGAVRPEAVGAFLHHVDISVLATNGNEGIPNVVLEAMAMGNPVIASDTGGCGEAIQNGVTGFLVPPRDPERLADRILRLLADEAEAARMGKAGHELAETEFALARMVERFARLYEGLAREKLGWASGER